MVNSKNLIAYFSRKGNNYVDGNIVNLPIGNTEILAKIIQEATGSDIFRIESTKKYPDDYTETTEVAKAELNDDIRPELADYIDDIDSYDMIFLGYPIWWGTFPMPVVTLLSKYDLSGKIIVPFCTHEGSGLGHSEKDIAKFCPKATVLNGLAIQGADVNNAKNDVINWLKNIGIINRENPND